MEEIVSATYTHTHVHVHTYTCTHIYIYIYIYIYMIYLVLIIYSADCQLSLISHNLIFHGMPHFCPYNLSNHIQSTCILIYDTIPLFTVKMTV